MEAALLLAAGRHIESSLGYPKVEAAANRMREAVGQPGLFEWNDEPERTQAEVVAKLRAVALGG